MEEKITPLQHREVNLNQRNNPKQNNEGKEEQWKKFLFNPKIFFLGNRNQPPTRCGQCSEGKGNWGERGESKSKSIDS